GNTDYYKFIDNVGYKAGSEPGGGPNENDDFDVKIDTGDYLLDARPTGLNNINDGVLRGLTLQNNETGDLTVNTSTFGIGPGNALFQQGQSVLFAFGDMQQEVGFVLNRWSSGGPSTEVQLIITIDDGLGGNDPQSFLITVPEPGSGFVQIVINEETITNAGGTYFEFSELSISFLTGGFNLSIGDLSYGANVIVEEAEYNFDITITDGDGDVFGVEDGLNVSLEAVDDAVDTALTGADGTPDVIVSGENEDIIDGGTGGNDTVDYSNSTNSVNVNLATAIVSGGYADGDTIKDIENVIGSAFNDTITGNGEDNIITGGPGNDSMFGEGGDDTFVAPSVYNEGGSPGTLEFNQIDGGNGTDDTLDYGHLSGTQFVALDMEANPGATLPGAAQIIDGITTVGEDLFVGIENVIGSEQSDFIFADDNNNRLEGGAGNDQLEGKGGNDILIGGTGDDLLVGGIGIDQMVGGQGKDTFVIDADSLSGSIDDLIFDYSGAGGDEDVIDLTALVDVAGGTDIVAEGYVSLNQNGLVAEVIVDTDGTAGAATPAIVAELLNYDMSTDGGVNILYQEDSTLPATGTAIV
ncbi:MAG: calcium-binding protein, partial [Rhizobiaceae bacterium]